MSKKPTIFQSLIPILTLDRPDRPQCYATGRRYALRGKPDVAADRLGRSRLHRILQPQTLERYPQRDTPHADRSDTCDPDPADDRGAGRDLDAQRYYSGDDPLRTVHPAPRLFSAGGGRDFGRHLGSDRQFVVHGGHGRRRTAGYRANTRFQRCDDCRGPSSRAPTSETRFHR